MTTATIPTVASTEQAVTSWLASTGWAVALGAASGSACVTVRLFFRLLQWIFVQQTGMLPVAAASLPSARRILTPLIGAALARGSLLMTHDLLWVLPLALVLGAVGPAYQKLLHLSGAAKRLPFALLWSGLAVGILGLIEPKVWGNGDAALLAVLQNKTMLLGIFSIFIFRLVATTFCVGTGTVGGVFTPTLFAGAALGLAIGYLLHNPQPSILALCGMGFLMAAVTHASLMAALMAVELTGQWHLLAIILPCNLLASFIARTISRESLYAIASPEPAQ
jgi:CIC family chloride channel protein